MKARTADAAAARRNRLAVRVVPNARKSEVAGWIDGVLRVRLQAPAVEGRANEELIRFLAELFGTRRSQIVILRGEKSRDKLVEIEGWDRTEPRLELAASGAMRRATRAASAGGKG
ncbi:conserved protein of unknown function [Methylacidimicrobium sp. AP8]|uniref:DUF167 domain-containing protein n=1 Tax=Methylacidimicrobium sp. AP8 TaxID=2730359 RepID=UPI0018C12B15|nr:DUF167 domain-containing protein [Methylacidimicrobium sp. AP8]CAB4244173.1 conserved protein of unknown function [Methylacidimicrobium sp. AP8]